MHHADALVIGQPECQRVDFVPPGRHFALGHQAASGSITLRRLSLVSLSLGSYQIWAACDNQYGFAQIDQVR
jgi:hypothetical protein